jgi:sigma-B regulation protein RsbU (phosphoserine phosphatase)
VLVGVILLFVVIYIVSYFYKKDINYEELTPAIVKRITERERIVKEIEAARHIQQSFLPDRIPDIKGLDIGSVCLPAYEVGGDYYDLFKIDDNKLAIVIGDVSGKGIKAAFYMTLVKGIIKAQSLMYSSPAEILSKANKIFFELVEKGNFISLIYGIFDLENKFLIYGNAGHNHIIIKEISKGGIRFDKTEGIALGLSEDPIFTNNIKEQVINFRPGDTFVFYTDGVVEAMNKDRMEYGNERFLDLINEISINSASEIVTIITQRVKKFIGKADQHDDLTLLVVKIK